MFFKQIEISKKKESLQDEGSDMKFSYQMLPWISCKVTYRYRNVNSGGSFSLANKSNLIVALCKIKGTILRLKKVHECKELFTIAISSLVDMAT